MIALRVGRVSADGNESAWARGVNEGKTAILPRKTRNTRKESPSLEPCPPIARIGANVSKPKSGLFRPHSSGPIHVLCGKNAWSSGFVFFVYFAVKNRGLGRGLDAARGSPRPVGRLPLRPCTAFNSSRTWR